ncbi:MULTISPECIES: RrF2 family transcriptional regulator [Robiginitalea]|uniref:Rrf2 family protein (Putative transcriptional regulator) n=1 Tax=Robiginitalea biformata (strain ATCC BAA-864 / DSM 15991 / KCTC 12146 / HTCC2501) TaxID=313596 RepID=A4CMB6_ROBBH|nr:MULTISPECIES: Rrf2 family transcriptional regulator [Robiginitalea]EAR14808.1 rrf2 family protein (putative transcriptional regulator) [Robiginitalea biformata HTCC2501]MDC6355340.1 Rrf2 family transcriptional regulator [Robiginitalea sp. PM2]MDC6375445.1 Rrf2 family transcriptional regulator [Robiginitalea sp. SP8]
MFSKACEYGIRAVVYIAHKSLEGQRVSLKEIADAIDSPVAFTAKILQQLSRNGLVDSVKGASGGFEMSEGRIREVRLADIVSVVDGNRVYEGCGLGLKKCNEHKPCPVHWEFVEVRDRLKALLETTSIHDMTLGVGSGISYLKR